MTYNEKLKNPLWLSKRFKIINRDDNKCKICKSETKLQVHHTLYFENTEPWNYEDKYLITLCENCHLDTENVIDKIKNLLSIIQQKEPWKLDNIRVLLERELTEDQFECYKLIKFKHT